MGDETSPTARRAGFQFVLGAVGVVTALTRSVRNIVPIGGNGTGAGVAGGKSVQGAEVVVTSLTRSIRYIFPEEGTGDPSPTARRAGIQFVQGANVVVFALTRSVRNIVPIGENGTGHPSSGCPGMCGGETKNRSRN